MHINSIFTNFSYQVLLFIWVPFDQLVLVRAGIPFQPGVDKSVRDRTLQDMVSVVNFDKHK